MTNSKSTKRALLLSALSILMCVAMLVGTTFAWFTDTASTAVNKIQAGTLDVALEVKEGGEWVSAEGKKLSFVKAGDAPDGETILWEPGCTYELPELRISNNGNLALKYKVVITGINGNAKLNEVIDWTIGDVSMGTEQHLAAGAADEFTIKGHMLETAGNEYQELTINGIAITVYATQDTVEYDSNNNRYDADATYYINKSGNQYGTQYNATKVALDSYTVEHKFNGAERDGIVFYLYNDAELTVGNMDFSTVVENDTGKRNIGFYVYNGSKLTINSGNFTMDGQWDAFIWAQGGKNGERCTVTINGGTFTIKGGDNSTIVNAYDGDVYCGSDVSITGGFFDLSDANPNVTLQWKNDSTMSVTGGTFVNYNPADHGVVPAGYKTVSLPQSNGKTWYKVIPDDSVIVNDVDELNDAMRNGKSIVLTDDITVDAEATTAESSYTTTAVNVDGKVFDGEGNTLTVTNANNLWDSGIMTSGGTIKNVTIKGSFRGIFTGGLSSDLHVDNVVLDDVTYTFSADGSGNHDVVFTNSTLNGWTSYTSGFRLVKFENTKFGASREKSYLRPYSNTELVNCEFTTAGFRLNAGGNATYTITLTNCTKNGTAITADNVQSLLLDMGSWNHNATLIVNGTTVTLH